MRKQRVTRIGVRLVVGAAVLSMSATAQAIVNLEQAITTQMPDGAHSELELAADGVSGNSNKSSLKAGLNSLYQHGEHAEFFKLQYAYGSSAGKIDTDRKFAHYRHFTRIEESWGWEGFAQASQDRFARLGLRSLVGGGTRWTLTHKENERGLYLGLGAFYEQENLNAALGTNDPLTSRLWRANSYLVWKQQLNEQLKFSSTTYFQPAVSTLADYRVLEQMSVLVKLTDDLNLKLALDASYDSRPPQTVRASDVRYSMGLLAAF